MPDTSPDDALASEQRMAFILGYARDPGASPAYRDVPAVFKVVTDERTYQQQRLAQHQRDLAALPPAPADEFEDEEPALAERRAALVAAAGSANKRQAMLFGLLKRMTGKEGHTGGTFFEVDL